jgi:hypothetical protein
MIILLAILIGIGILVYTFIGVYVAQAFENDPSFKMPASRVGRGIVRLIIVSAWIVFFVVGCSRLALRWIFS